MDRIQALREEITATAKQAFEQKLFAGTSGNLSAYIKEENLILITPTCVRYETMVPEDIVVIRPDGEKVEGHYEPSSEWRLHAAIYKAYPELGSIFHTHSPYATAFAVVHQPIETTLIETYFFLGGEVRCAEYATPGTWAVGENAVPALKDRGGCLLNNHGVVAVGKDIPEAHLRAEYIEDAAKIGFFARQLGEPVILPKL